VMGSAPSRVMESRISPIKITVAPEALSVALTMALIKAFEVLITALKALFKVATLIKKPK